VAHFITARGRRPRRALAFSAAGGLVFRRFVHHPGTPAERVMGRTLDEQWPTVRAIYEREIAREVGAA
jgi:hypothetical protein